MQLIKITSYIVFLILGIAFVVYNLLYQREVHKGVQELQVKPSKRIQALLLFHLILSISAVAVVAFFLIGEVIKTQL